MFLVLIVTREKCHQQTRRERSVMIWIFFAVRRRLYKIKANKTIEGCCYDSNF